MTTPTPTTRQKVINQILVLMGNNLIDIDYQPEDLETCMDIALDRYRQRAANSMQEIVFFLPLEMDKQTYTLPKEVVEVNEILRRGLGVNAGINNSGQYDPFTLAYTNVYLLMPTGQGDLLTYELYHQWLETAGRLFGAKYDFIWDGRTKKLTIMRWQQAPEECLIKAYVRVPEDQLLEDTYSGPWIRSYAMAHFKMLLGQAYEKFQSIPGPGGGTSLNGSQLKAEGAADIEKLDREILTFTDGSKPLGFIIG